MAATRVRWLHGGVARGPLAVDQSRRLAPAGPAGIARAWAPWGFRPSGQRVGPVSRLAAWRGSGPPDSDMARAGG